MSTDGAYVDGDVDDKEVGCNAADAGVVDEADNGGAADDDSGFVADDIVDILYFKTYLFLLCLSLIR